MKSYTLSIDGNSMLKNAYHGSKKSDTYNYSDGTWVFICVMRKICKKYNVTRINTFWDGEKSGILKYDKYPNYKSSRKDYKNGTKVIKDPKEHTECLKEKELIQDVLFNLHVYQYETYKSEADDCIAEFVNKSGGDHIVVTGDSDLLQLIDDDVSIYYLHRDKSKGGIYDQQRFFNTFGYHHKNIPIIKSIAGDSADDIKGLKGWALYSLLKEFEDVLKKKNTITQLVNKAKMVNLKRSELKQKPLKKITLLEDVLSNKEHKNMFDIINLEVPIIEDGESEKVLNLPLDNMENRKGENIIKIFQENGYVSTIKEYYYCDIKVFLKPFFNLIKLTKEHEENKVNNCVSTQ